MALGNPHFSLAECSRLGEMCGSASLTLNLTLTLILTLTVTLTLTLTLTPTLTRCGSAPARGEAKHN